MNENKLAQKIVDALEQMVENCFIDDLSTEQDKQEYRVLNQAYNRALSILEGF